MRLDITLIAPNAGAEAANMLKRSGYRVSAYMSTDGRAVLRDDGNVCTVVGKLRGPYLGNSARVVLDTEDAA